jgi:hypothetical protein
MGFDPFEKGQITDQAVLDDFRQPCLELPIRQGIENLRIGQHQPGLVEGADHVLAEGMIDGGLAPDRGIHLGQQCCRHLDEGHAPLVGGRGKPRPCPRPHRRPGRSGWCCGRNARPAAIEDEVEGRPVLVASPSGSTISVTCSPWASQAGYKRLPGRAARPHRW